eukprot:Seg2039.1 transcript_id=Seg2039.1/GoldUCD/mRNA.D3Y31 product="Tetratricopeptide repeat protein 17" protein_id=Seg2039.1/GoldUCD/D3Y31
MKLLLREYCRYFVIGLFVYLSLISLPSCLTVTHWFVDQDGKIKQQTESIYNLKAPGDLITFMEQESKMRKLEDLQTELLSKRDVLQPSELEKVDIESQMFRSDPDCVESKKRLTEYDLHLSSIMRLEMKQINVADYLNLNETIPEEPKKPHCSVDLPFSMYAYDHLKGVATRGSIHNSSEQGLISVLPSIIPDIKDVNQFGNVIAAALEKNETSWILLNLAGIYWRVAGPTNNAVECLRRALHYSSRQHKDIALASMANVLHRAKHSLDAAILMHAALETSVELDIAYFALGNIYASLGQFDLAELCYKYVEELHPGFEAAIERKHAARCEQKLDKQLEKQHEFLQKTLDDLEDFRHKHQILEEQQKELLSHKQHAQPKLNIYIPDHLQMKIIEYGKDSD